MIKKNKVVIISNMTHLWSIIVNNIIIFYHHCVKDFVSYTLVSQLVIFICHEQTNIFAEPWR